MARRRLALLMVALVFAVGLLASYNAIRVVAIEGTDGAPSEGTCTTPGDLVGTWAGSFSGSLHASWVAASPGDTRPTQWNGEMSVSGWVTLTIHDPSIEPTVASTIGLRMDFVAAERGDAPDGSRIDVNGFGVLRGDDVAFDLDQALPGPYPLLWSGGEWSPPETPYPAPSGGLAIFYTPPPGSEVPRWHADSGVTQRPAPPLQLTIVDVTCDNLGGEVIAPFWAYSDGSQTVAVTSSLAVSLQRLPCFAPRQVSPSGAESMSSLDRQSGLERAR